MVQVMNEKQLAAYDAFTAEYDRLASLKHPRIVFSVTDDGKSSMMVDTACDGNEEESIQVEQLIRDLTVLHRAWRDTLE